MSTRLSLDSYNMSDSVTQLLSKMQVFIFSHLDYVILKKKFLRSTMKLWIDDDSSPSLNLIWPA